MKEKQLLNDAAREIHGVMFSLNSSVMIAKSEQRDKVCIFFPQGTHTFKNGEQVLLKDDVEVHLSPEEISKELQVRLQKSLVAV